jgi:serine/threonine-protein kinase
VDTNLAEVYEAAGDLDRAADAAREALAIRRTNPADPRTGYALRAIARIESARGRFDDARAHAEEARALAVRTLGPDHPQVASSLRTLGTVDLRQQRWANCRDRYTEAIAIQRRLEGGNLADLLEARANRAWCVAQLDQLPAARDELTEVVELAQARLPADTRALWFRYRHAEVLRRAGDPRARQLLEELLPAVRELELRSLVEAALAPRR